MRHLQKTRLRWPQLWRGCVGAWAPCLGPSGVTLRDWSGYGNHGTLTNMEADTDWIAASGQYTLDFDGSNEYVTAGKNVGSLDGSSKFTLSAWIRTSSASPNIAWMAYASTSSNNPIILFRFGNPAGEPKLFVRDDSGTGTELGPSGITINDGSWHHVATTKSGANVVIYIDGKAVFTSSSATTGATTLNTFAIGALLRSTASNLWPGQIDDLRVYNRDVNSNEITLLACRRGIAYETDRVRRYTPEQITALRRKYLTLLGVGN